MYRIGVFSKLGKTTVKTLRHYDEEGLLKPAHVDEENGYRYYTTDQLFTLHKIVALRQMGFSVAEVSEMLCGRSISGILEQRRAELESELAAVTDRLFRINHYIENRKEGFSMEYQVVTKEIPECIVFSKRQVIPNYDAYFELYPTVGEAVAKANPELKCIEPEYCFSIYHDREYKETDIDVEICQAVTDFGVETEGVVFKKIPAVTVASVMHKGPYSDLRAAYASVFRWIADNGCAVADDPRESYIDGIWNKDNEAEWLTEVQVPFNKK